MACPYLSELQEALLGKAFSVKSGYLNNKSSNNRFASEHYNKAVYL